MCPISNSKLKHTSRLVSGSIWLPTVVSIAGLTSSLPTHAAQPPLEEWRISPPVYMTRERPVTLHRVAAAAVLDDRIVIADAGNRRLLLMSADGAVTDSLGRRGSGPGEFQWIHSVFAIGDTVIAFDAFQSRVTVWVPGSEGTPRVTRLPTSAGGLPTELRGALSASTWILATRESIAEGSSGLRDLSTTVMAFDVASREIVTLGRRRSKYTYFSPGANSTTTYSMHFLGSAHVGGANGRWFFLPMDRPVVELREVGQAVASEIVLPIEPTRYAASDWRLPMDSVLAIASGVSHNRLRAVYNDLEREVPRRIAPPVRRAVRMGELLWVEVFQRVTEGESEWLVTNLSEGAVQARVVIEDSWTLLAGTATHVVILTRTELGEEVIEVRAIIPGHESFPPAELGQSDCFVLEEFERGAHIQRRCSSCPAY